MFDLDASKIVIVGVAALIFIPPKDLPRVMRQVGQFVGKMRRMASEFQGQFMDAMREADMADLRKEADKLSDAVRIDTGLNSIHDLDNHMRPLAPQPLETVKMPPAASDAPPPLELGALARNAPTAAPPPTEHAAPRAPSPALEPQPTPEHTS